MPSDYEELAEQNMEPRKRYINVWPVFSLPDDEDESDEPWFTGLWQDEQGCRHDWSSLPRDALLSGIAWLHNLPMDKIRQGVIP